MKIRVATPIRPTEAPERVRQAILNLFPDANLEASADRIAGSVVDLQAFRRRIWELRIIDSARGQILHGLTPDLATIRFRLSKQAALANQVAFPPRPHILGDIEVIVEAEANDTLTPEQWAWWLCPETQDGEIVGPM
ncbi:MAG: RNA-binding domain-containing protein [Candidatus Thermoplasmatota archaeon]